MVRALVNIIEQREKDVNASKEMKEAIFIFMKVINYWLMVGMKYVKGSGRD